MAWFERYLTIGLVDRAMPTVALLGRAITHVIKKLPALTGRYVTSGKDK